jgi:hypothetical protein
MKNPVRPCLLALLLAPLSTACVGTTGGGLVDFDAAASGPADASGAPFTDHAYTFVSPYSGWTITLKTATLQIGAVYLDATPCTGGSAILPCVNENAATVAQVNGGAVGDFGVQTSGVLLDALSPDAQPFLSGGSGIIQQARSAEVWLSSGAEAMAIDDLDDASTIAQVAGTATKGDQTYPFTGTVTISKNRLLPISNPALPGESPICDQRIVRPICLPTSPAVEPEAGTALRVEVDPKGWFNNVDFEKLDTTVAPPYPIPDSNDDRNGRNLLQGIESSSGVYSFTFQSP